MAIVTRQLVGREKELASLVGLLSGPLPAAAVISGDAGIGKTALWRAALAEARTRGHRALVCRSSESEARYSYSGLGDVMRVVLPDVLPELPVPQRRALETALGLSEADGRVEQRLVAFAFLAAVRKAAEASPVLLAVDDLQWLDRASSAVLRYALPRLDDEPVAAVMTVRGAAPAWLSRNDELLELELQPLSVGALHEVLRTRLDAALARPVLLRIWETSGGNPFYALELARALRRRGRVEPGAELPVPAALEDLVLERLEALSPAALEACRVAAAAAGTTVAHVEALVGGGPAGVEEALQARVLELDGERLRFTHPLLASALAGRTVGQRKRSLHERLASLASDPEERARHLALAASGPSARVSAALDAASDHARTRGSAAAAAELAERAVALTPPGDGEARRRRRLDAADLHFEAGDVERALSVLEEAREEAPPGPARAAVLLRLGRVRAETSGADQAVSDWREALAEAGGDDALEARIRFQLGQFLRFTEGAEKALAELRSAVEAAARVEDDELNCRVLAAHALVHFNSGRGIDHEGMERALALEPGVPGSRPMATLFYLHQLVWSGDVERAREVHERWEAWVRGRDHPDSGDAAWYRALLEWRHGDWDTSAAAAAAAISLAEQFGREAATITSWPAAVIAAHRGELDRARMLAERGLGAPTLPPVGEAGYEWVLGFIQLSLDDARGALGYLERAQRINAELGILEPALLWFMPDLLDALLAAGAVERAEEALAPFARRARDLDRPWAIAIAARTEATIAAGRGDVDGAWGRFDEAFEAHERAPDRFQHARTLLALGGAQRRAKRRAAARQTLERAVAVLDELPAPQWAAKARAELARIGGRAPSRDELTEAEQRIAALVAEGSSNREVAAALFLTEHTVETALTRIYRKLGVRSRTALAQRLSAKT